MSQLNFVAVMMKQRTVRLQVSCMRCGCRFGLYICCSSAMTCRNVQQLSWTFVRPAAPV